MGFFTALALVFITLKLIGVITWSWWLVLLPILPFLALLGFILFGYVVLGMTFLYNMFKHSRK